MSKRLDEINGQILKLKREKFELECKNFVLDEKKYKAKLKAMEKKFYDICDDIHYYHKLSVIFEDDIPFIEIQMNYVEEGYSGLFEDVVSIKDFEECYCKEVTIKRIEERAAKYLGENYSLPKNYKFSVKIVQK